MSWSSALAYRPPQSTVLLNANIAFLAVPFVESNNGPFRMSLSAVLSQISTLISLGSILSGLQLFIQIREEDNVVVDDVVSSSLHITIVNCFNSRML